MDYGSSLLICGEADDDLDENISEDIKGQRRQRSWLKHT